MNEDYNWHYPKSPTISDLTEEETPGSRIQSEDDNLENDSSASFSSSDTHDFRDHFNLESLGPEGREMFLDINFVPPPPTEDSFFDLPIKEQNVKDKRHQRHPSTSDSRGSTMEITTSRRPSERRQQQNKDNSKAYRQRQKGRDLELVSAIARNNELETKLSIANDTIWELESELAATKAKLEEASKRNWTIKEEMNLWAFSVHHSLLNRKSWLLCIQRKS